MASGGGELFGNARKEVVPLRGEAAMDEPVRVFEPTSRHRFFDAYASDQTGAGFVDFLFGRDVRLPDEADFSNAHIAALGAFHALQAGVESQFRRAYEEMSRRRVQADVPWLLNDPLFYSLVLGAVRFGGDQTWLRETLQFRGDHTTGEAREITMTFGDILRENWGNSANVRPLVLLARYHLGLDTSDTELLDQVYRMTTEATFPYRESNFLNAVYLRAFDVVMHSKAPEDPARRKAVEHMVRAMWRKARIVAWAVWTGGAGLLILALIGLVSWVKGIADEDLRAWIEALELLGIPIVAAIPLWPWITQRTRILGCIQRFTLRRFFCLDPDVLTPTQKREAE